MHTNVCTEELYLIEMCRAIGVYLPEDQLIFFFLLNKFFYESCSSFVPRL